jgi:phosphatidylglycerophosphatase A
MTILATGFGLGYSPVASGTVGTLWGVLIVIFLFPALGIGAQIATAIVLSLLSIPICDAAEKVFQTKDDGRIVADEYLTFPICLIGLVGPEVGVRWWVVLIAFLTCRFFDIVKPFPARQLQVLHGGFGITIDDIAASLYSLIANHAIVWAILRFVF